MAGGLRKPNSNKSLIPIKELLEELKNEKIGTYNNGANINFANYVLKYNARQNEPMGFKAAYATGVFALYPFYVYLRDDEHLKAAFGDPKLAQIQAISVLSSIYNKATNDHPLAHIQLAGIIASIFDYDIKISENGFLKVKANDVFDNCGTGGDTTNTFHVSTSAALIAASQGIKVGKHGSPGNAQRSGSSDFILSLGINNEPKPQAIVESIDQANFGYIEAIDERYKRIHVQTHGVAHMAHMNDIIGPMTNPIDPQNLTGKLLGVNQVISPLTVAKTYLILNALGVTNIKKAMIVRGYNLNGKAKILDEISTMKGGTEAVLMHDGTLKSIHLTHNDFGFKRASSESEISPPANSKQGRLEYTIKVLEGKAPQGAANLLAANAGTLIALSKLHRKGDKLDLKEGTVIAMQAIKDKLYLDVISKVKEAQRKYG